MLNSYALVEREPFQNVRAAAEGGNADDAYPIYCHALFLTSNRIVLCHGTVTETDSLDEVSRGYGAPGRQPRGGENPPRPLDLCPWSIGRVIPRVDPAFHRAGDSPARRSEDGEAGRAGDRGATTPPRYRGTDPLQGRAGAAPTASGPVG